MAKKQIKKGFISALSILGIGTVSIATVSYMSFSQVNNVLKRIYVFDNETFNNFEDLSKRMQSKYLTSSFSTTDRNKWSIKDGKNILYFNDSKTLREFLETKIANSVAYSSYNLSNSKYIGENGELTSQAFSKLHFNNGEIINKATIYKGKDNSIHKTIEDAKNSYLSVHDAYYFNEMFFRSKEQLQLYLEDEFYGQDPNNPGYQTLEKGIGIISSNGIISNSINSKYLFSNGDTDSVDQEKIIDAKKTFASFVSSNLNKYLKIKDIDGNYNLYDKNDIQNSHNLVNIFDNPDYTRLYSNRGYGSYVVDLNEEDKNTLFGPYYASSTKDIELMYDHKQWKKITKNDPIILEEKDTNLLASFLSNILMPEEEKSFDDLPINIRSINNVLERYFNELKSFNSSLFEEYKNMYRVLQSGKRFNLFNGIIISHKWLINRLILNKAPEKMIKLTKETFNTIAKTIDIYVNLIFDDTVLVSKRIGDKLSFEKILAFNNNNHDLNSTLKSYIDQISTNWPQFIVCLNVINFAQINSFSNGGAIKFDYEKFKRIIDSTKSYKENVFLDENKSVYEYLYNLFSSDNSDEFHDRVKNKISSSTYEKNKEFILELSFSFTYGAKMGSNVTRAIYENTLYSFENSDPFLVSKINQTIYKNLPSSIVLKMNAINEEAKNHQDYPERPEYITKEKISFENFVLINFVWKLFKSTKNISDSSILEINNLLESFRKNLLNNEMLSNELTNIVNRFNDENFMNNFAVFNDTQSIMKEIDNNAYALSMYENIIKEFSKCFDGYKEFSKYTELSINVMKTTFSIIDEIKDLSKINKVFKQAFSTLKIASAAFIYVNIALEVMDLVIDGLVPKTEYFSYIFENDDTKFIWNGGMKKTMFWGMLPLEQTTIKDMKLNDPIKVVEPNNEEQYYFNGKKYSDLNILKRQQLDLIINGQYNINDSMSTIYSFENAKSNPVSAKTFNNIGSYEDILSLDSKSITTFEPQNLIQYIYKEIYLELNKPKDEWIYHKENFIFEGSGITISPGENFDEIVYQILRDIRTVKIAQIPILENGKPKDFASKEEFEMMNAYELPSYSWSIEGTKYNGSNKKYIIFNPNVEGLSDISNDVVMKNIKSQFYEQFDVDSKVVLEHDINVNNKFSEMETNIINYNIYKATLPTGYSKYFIDHSKALNWLSSNMEFTVYEQENIINNYEYKEKIFNSKEEFESYLIANMEVKNG